MSIELRRLIDRKATEELVEALKRRDLDEWRAEAFPLIESILLERGVDVAAVMAQRPDRGDETDAGESDRQESTSFVKVMDLPNVALLAIAKSLLEEGGFRFYVTNDNTQDFIGLGQLGAGFNLITGPPALMVESSRAQEAEELLEPLLTDTIPDVEDVEDEDA